MTGKTFTFRGISVSYGPQVALHDVKGTIHPGDRIAIIGPNASGKSTLLRALAGLHPAEGTVQLGDEIISYRLTEERAQAGIAYLRQSKNVFPTLTAQENLELAHRAAEGANFAEHRDWLLTTFPVLTHSLHKRAGWLSAGERQVLALGMVLMNRPTTLLLDEPLAGLAEGAALAMMRALAIAQEKLHFGYALVEHRFPQVRDFVQQVWLMKSGQIVEYTPDASILWDESRLATHFLQA